MILPFRKYLPKAESQSKLRVLLFSHLIHRNNDGKISQEHKIKVIAWRDYKESQKRFHLTPHSRNFLQRNLCLYLHDRLD